MTGLDPLTAMQYIYFATTSLALLGILIYVADTFVYSYSTERPPAVLPIVTWLALAPIIIIPLSLMGQFSSSVASDIVKSAGTHLDAIRVLSFLTCCLCMVVFLFGFARCVYTINLLDMDVWWNVSGFRTRYLAGRHGALEFAIRFAIATAFVVHQNTILQFVVNKPAVFGDPGALHLGILDQSLSRLGHLLPFMFRPPETVASANATDASLDYFILTGLCVFGLILCWWWTVRQAVEANGPPGATSGPIGMQLDRQRSAGVLGILLMVIIWVLNADISKELVIMLIGLFLFFCLYLLKLVFFNQFWEILCRWFARKSPALAE